MAVTQCHLKGGWRRSLFSIEMHLGVNRCNHSHKNSRGEPQDVLTMKPDLEKPKSTISLLYSNCTWKCLSSKNVRWLHREKRHICDPSNPILAGNLELCRKSECTEVREQPRAWGLALSSKSAGSTNTHKDQSVRTTPVGLCKHCS